MAGYEDRPRTRAELDRRIEREFGFRQGYASVAAVMAAAVVARLLPSGAVKGGSALRLRYGDGATRFTDDVDVARTGTEGKYRDALALSLRDGWGGFSGTIEALPGRNTVVVGAAPDVHIDNLCIKYCGAHAIGAGARVLGILDELAAGGSPDGAAAP